MAGATPPPPTLFIQRHHPQPDTEATIMNDASRYYKIPPWILPGIYGAESSFGKTTTNWFGLVDVPRTGTFSGDAHTAAKTIAALIKKHKGNVNAALEEYNQGPGGVGKDQKYIQSVRNSFHLWRTNKGGVRSVNLPTNPVQDAAASPAGDVVAGALTAAAWPIELGKLLSKLNDPAFWRNAGKLLLGLAIIALGFHYVSGGAVGRGAKKAAFLAAK